MEWCISQKWPNNPPPHFPRDHTHVPTCRHTAVTLAKAAEKHRRNNPGLVAADNLVGYNTQRGEKVYITYTINSSCWDMRRALKVSLVWHRNIAFQSFGCWQFLLPLKKLQWLSLYSSVNSRFLCSNLELWMHGFCGTPNHILEWTKSLYSACPGLRGIIIWTIFKLDLNNIQEDDK